MEKFGIFELLDALSALTAKEAAKNPSAPSSEDTAFAPPQYPSAGDNPQKGTAPGQDALANFYARHDALAKKAKK